MKSPLVIVLLVGLLGLTVAAEGEMELLKRLLAALRDTDSSTHLEKRNSYGLVWKGGRDRTLYIYLQRTRDCKDPCRFEITFQDDDGKSLGKPLYEVFDREEGGRLVYTEDEILRRIQSGKDKEAGNGENDIGGGSLRRLPDNLLVRVCMIEKAGPPEILACNKRPVDLSKERDAVFFKTVPDDSRPDPNV